MQLKKTSKLVAAAAGELIRQASSGSGKKGSSGGKKSTKKAAKKSTKQKTKTKKKRSDNICEGGDGKGAGSNLKSGISDRHVWYDMGKPVKNIIKTARNQYSYNLGTVCTSSEGSLGVTELYAIGALNQWITGTAIPIAYNQSNVAWKDLNPAQKITGSGFFPAGTVPANDRFVLTHCRTMLDIVNQTNAAARMIIFGFRAKRDISYGPKQLWDQLLTLERLGSSDAAAPVKGTSYTTAAGNEISTFPYTEPQEIKGFNSIFATEFRIKLDLADGGTERIHISGWHNYLYKQEVLTETGQFYPKGSLVVMAIQQGQAIFDITQISSAAINKMSLGSTQIGVVVHNKLTFHSVKAATNRLNTTTVQWGIPAGADLTNEKFINYLDLEGGIVNVA